MDLRDIPPTWRAPASLLAFAAAILIAWFVLSSRAEAGAEKIAIAAAATAVAPVKADLDTHKATEEVRHRYEEDELKKIGRKLDDIAERLPPKR